MLSSLDIFTAADFTFLTCTHASNIMKNNFYILHSDLNNQIGRQEAPTMSAFTEGHLETLIHENIVSQAHTQHSSKEK